MLLPLLAGLALHAQVVTAAPNTPPPFDPHPAVELLIHALDESAPDHTRFTYHKRERIITQLQTGEVVYDKTSSYEVTWINDRPYWRLIAVNDQPLSDKDQKDEQKLYDKALAKNKDLGEKQRLEMQNGTLEKRDADPAMLLTPLYTFTEKASEALPSGGTVHLVEATLVPGAKPKSHCRYRFQLWITQPDNQVLKYMADVPGSKEFTCANSKDVGTFSIVDGVLKPTHWATRFFPDDAQGAAAINDDAFTNYQWFSTDGDTDKKATVHSDKPNTSAPPQPAETPPPPQ